MSGLTDDFDEERRGFRRGGRIVWGTFAVPSFLASPDSRAVALNSNCLLFCRWYMREGKENNEGVTYQRKPVWMLEI